MADASRGICNFHHHKTHRGWELLWRLEVSSSQVNNTRCLYIYKLYKYIVHSLACKPSFPVENSACSIICSKKRIRMATLKAWRALTQVVGRWWNPPCAMVDLSPPRWLCWHEEHRASIRRRNHSSTIFAEVYSEGEVGGAVQERIGHRCLTFRCRACPLACV